jgi:hypothetical protein
MPALTHLGRWDGYGVGWRSFTEPHLEARRSSRKPLSPFWLHSQRWKGFASVSGCWLDWKAKSKALGRPSVNRRHDMDAKKIKALRDAGDSYESTAGELRRIRAALRGHLQLLPASAGSTPASLCVQTSCAT